MARDLDHLRLFVGLLLHLSYPQFAISECHPIALISVHLQGCVKALPFAEIESLAFTKEGVSKK